MLSDKLKHLPIDFRPSKRRKTLGLKVGQGKVIVAFPVWARKSEVYDWLNEKADWIVAHYQPAKPAEIELPYTPESKIWWQGEQVPLSQFFAQGHEFYSHALHKQKAGVLELCARELAAGIEERVAAFEQHLGFRCNALKLRPYKSRWGSCDHKGLVALNTLLAMAPPWVVDYVIVHELCHLKHPNHSASFWAEVARGSSPRQTKQAKAWLRNHGEALLTFYR